MKKCIVCGKNIMKKYEVVVCDMSKSEQIEAENMKEAKEKAEELAEDMSNDNESYKVIAVYKVN
jgi:hypothetical protein